MLSFRSIMLLDPSGTVTLFRPSLYYQIFIPCDVISLVLQAAGGALSTVSDGQSGVSISLAGLAFQVFTLLVFIVLGALYTLDFQRKGSSQTRRPDNEFKLFAAFLAFATVAIFVRCAFRIYELNGGYTGAAIRDEGLFIGLESWWVINAGGDEPFHQLK